MYTRQYEVVEVLTWLLAEHIIELATIGQFLKDAAARKLQSDPNKMPLRLARVPREFIQQFKTSLDGLTSLEPNGQNSSIPMQRIFDQLGTKESMHSFVLLPAPLNGLKARIWQTWNNKKAYSNARMIIYDDPYKTRGNPKKVLEAFRNVLVIFNYLNHPTVERLAGLISREVQTQLKEIEDAWNAIHGDNPVFLSESWAEWIEDLAVAITNRQKKWLQHWIDTTRILYDAYYKKKGNSEARDWIRDRLNTYEKEYKSLSINTQHWTNPYRD